MVHKSEVKLSGHCECDFKYYPAKNSNFPSCVRLGHHQPFSKQSVSVGETKQDLIGSCVKFRTNIFILFLSNTYPTQY